MMQVRRHLYPENWKQLAMACKERANWRCQRCHIHHGKKRISRRTGQVYSVWLHAAHMRLHDTLNPDPELMALCPRCHGRYDYRLRQREKDVHLEVLKHRYALRLHKGVSCVEQ